MTAAAEQERLRTWLLEIIEALVENARWQEEGDELRLVGHGGLTINRRTGAWFSHSAGRGGLAAKPLVAVLRGCSRDEASSWVDAWAQAHPGTGRLIGADEEVSIDSAAIARGILDRLADPTNTAAETYLRSRGITEALPACIKFLPDARVGEGALAAALAAHGRIVGVQLTYLDPAGRKSTVKPGRRRFNLEKAADAVFEIQAAAAGVADLQADTFIAEGVEDGLSVAELGRPVRVVALPGIGTLAHFPVKRGERIVVIRDGDLNGSAADTALHNGLDHLLLEGAFVRLTQTPTNEDANSLIQKGGTAALVELISGAAPAKLSLSGEITRLSRLDQLAYEQERKFVAERRGVRVGSLDRAVAKKRATAHPGNREADDETAGQGRPIELPVVEPWPEPVDGAAVLDGIAAGIARYLILEKHQAHATALWVVFTHSFDSFEVAPKLVLRSAQKRSGKTRNLEVLVRLVAKPLETSGISAASLLRVIERGAPTLLLDEFDTMMKGGAEMAEALRGILNSGFNRSLARLIKSVPVPAGGWEEREFSTWCPQVLAGIGKVPDTVADRSIEIEMRRKKRTEKVSRLRSRDGGELRILARQAARWAEDHHVELAAADPATPGQLNDRTADAWSPLLAIADAAGEEWPQRARQAAVLLAGEEDTSTPETELLADTRAAFEAKRLVAKTEAAIKVAGQLTSDELVAALVEMEAGPWAEISNGRPLTKHGLAHRLKPFHISPGTLWLGENRTRKGYKREQFEDAFDRYLAPLPPLDPNSTVRSSDAAENQGFQSDFKPSGTPPPDGSKNAENASVSAAPDDLPVENAVNGGGAREGGAGPAPNGDARLNGAAPHSTLSELDRDIIEFGAAFPSWTAARIAKRFGQPRDVVAQLLGRDR